MATAGNKNINAKSVSIDPFIISYSFYLGSFVNPQIVNSTDFYWRIVIGLLISDVSLFGEFIFFQFLRNLISKIITLTNLSVSLLVCVAAEDNFCFIPLF
ncbi:unnamed protein product [Eruca vesicaria subsp. sativa]|uniref:Uncharacterized protein n=1 Tax=Eruca vesicaria subsp. sativa TaxID=29727 RepID=A0ABC8LHW2_ERUVS|nr:unnamed protein product [Eruca vesicaria subsp. sativa]